MKQFLPQNIKKYLKDKKDIFDVGNGPSGSYWWKFIDNDAEVIGIDLYFFPKSLQKNIKLYRYDASQLDKISNAAEVERYRPRLIGGASFMREKVYWENQFDMVVANHVLEHVNPPKKVIKGINKLMKKGGIVYIGFPDFSNFTDKFYHLIHPDGGGHVNKLNKHLVLNLFIDNGFKLIESNIWPDNWDWLEDLYDYKSRGIKLIDKQDIEYLAGVFRRELTSNKGYFYGWEMILEKL